MERFYIVKYGIVHPSRTVQNWVETKRALISSGTQDGMLLLGTPRSKSYLVPKEDVLAFEVTEEISTKQELKEYSTAFFNTDNHDVQQFVAIKERDVWYITNAWTYDSRDNSYRMSYGSSYSGWFSHMRSDATFYKVRQISSIETGVVMPTIKSPNADKTFASVKLSSYTDGQLFDTIVRLSNTLLTVERGDITKEQVVALSLYDEKDLTGGMELLKSEVDFRSKRADLEELARVEAELEALKSREEKQKEAQAKKAALEARLGSTAAAVTSG